MPYDYLTINEQDLSYGIVSASYFSKDLQSLYEQQILNSQEFFGDSDDDILELSIYNSNQEPILFNRVIPKTTYSVVQGSYRDINGNLKNYNVKNPITNYAIYGNELLLHSQFDLKINELNPGQYYVLYNPIRNIAGNVKNRLFIKEISPSRTELRLSFAFNTTSNETNRLDSIKISSFADKKFVFLQVVDELIPIVNKNPIDQSFTFESNTFNYIKYAQLLGLKSAAQLQEFINSVYTGYNKTVNLSDSADTVVSENSIFVGVSDQIKNFIYTYNDIEFSKQEILDAVKIIVTKVSQDAILQKTSLTDLDLQETLNVFTTIIFNDWLSPKISELLENYSYKYYGIYKNVLNFDLGKFVKILNHTSYLNPADGRMNVQIKLDAPLPLEYSIKDTCWISNISLSPVYFKINLYTAPVSRKVYLNGVNFTVNVPSINSSNDEFSGYQSNTLFSAKSRVQQKVNDLLINYDEFTNFINFSSAELRSKIAKNKISKFNTLESSKTELAQKANSQTNTSISASYSDEFGKIENEQILLLDSLDEYESYLFYNTSSIDDKIENGVQFDKLNYNSLIYQLPEYIKDSNDYSDYLKFTAMVGHFFDNILVFIKKFPKSYPINYDDNNSYPKNYIEELLNSFNWNVTNDKFNKSDINQLLFTNTQMEGTLSSSYFTYAKSIFNRIANNLNYIYKTKGTSTSFGLIRSIFGISTDLINVVEYTSPDVLVSKNVYYDFDDTVYMTRFTDNQYLKFNFTGSEYSFDLTSQWTSGSSNLRLTKSCQEVFTGISTIESTFRLDQPNKYDFQDKIPIIKKLRNNKVDWQVYLKKSKQQQSANLIFELIPNESGFTSSLSTMELPYLNGDFFTFMVTREPNPNIQIDKLTLVSQSNYNNTTQSLTSSAAQQYVPHTYKLSVNQYYGSQLNFTDTVTKTVSYSQNKYFSSGSYYVANYSSSKQFYGNLDKIKIQKLPLSEDDFKEHSYNLNSTSITDKALIYSNMYYLWSFDTPVNLYGTPYFTVDNQNGFYDTSFYAYNFDRNSTTRGYPYCDVISTDIFPYQFEKFNIKQAINSNRYGPNYKSNANINKITQTVDSNLVPYEYSSYTNDIQGSDSNLVGYYITPYQYLNSKIEDFLGKEGISDIIGDPKYLTSRNYPELKLRQKQFAETNLKYVYPQENYSTYKFYIDFSVFDFIKKLSPTRSTLKTGLLLEPSIFERVKFNYKDVVTTTVDTNNSSSVLVLNSTPSFSSSLINTNDSSSYGIVSLDYISRLDTDHNTYNYSLFEINDSIDDRDFIFAKYGKYIYLDDNGYNIRNAVKFASNDYYQLVNNDGKIITFTSSYDTIQIIGSGSGLNSNQITGSKYLSTLYSGSIGNGYSHRHLSKFVKVGTRVKKQAISGSKYSIINGVKTLTTGKVTYYTYTKGQNTTLTTVNRQGVTNGSSPIITIKGFLAVDMESDNFPLYGTLTGSIGDATSLFVPQPLTCSTCASASLNTYIMNL